MKVLKSARSGARVSLVLKIGFSDKGHSIPTVGSSHLIDPLLQECNNRCTCIQFLRRFQRQETMTNPIEHIADAHFRQLAHTQSNGQRLGCLFLYQRPHRKLHHFHNAPIYLGHEAVLEMHPP